jgi:hypothetical protein
MANDPKGASLAVRTESGESQYYTAGEVTHQVLSTRIFLPLAMHLMDESGNGQTVQVVESNIPLPTAMVSPMAMNANKRYLNRP